MFQLQAHERPSLPAGSVAFDDRGNACWVPHEEVVTAEAVMRLLAVDTLEIVEDYAA